MSDSVTPFLIVGLGNPGDKYLLNRHNVGFFLLDFIKSNFSHLSDYKNEHKSYVCSGKIENQKIILAKPQTFMNLSGQAVQSLLSFYKIPLSQLLVIHDDLDLPFGQLKLQTNRGHGGQNGIRSIHECLGNSNYTRLKFGIGRPPHANWDIADWVLSNWSPEEQKLLNESAKKAESAVLAWLTQGAEKAANLINRSN